MKKSKRIVIFFLFFLLVSWPCFAKDTTRVTVTIIPLVEFVEQVGGDLVEVNAIIPPGGNPHSYEPTPKQLVSLSKSKLYVKVGSGVEFELSWMDKLLAQNKNMRLCDASKGIRLMRMEEHDHHEEEGHGDEDEHYDEHGDEDEHHDEHKEKAHDHGHHHEGKDPHIWLSPKNAIKMVSNIRNALIKIDPKNKKQYKENASNYIRKLKELHKEIKGILANAPSRKFLIFHPAWGYFARDYRFEQIAAEHCGKEPTPKQLQHLIEQAHTHSIKTIFVSPQFSDKSAKVIASEIGGTVDSINPLAKNYIDNLRHVAKLLSN